MAPQLLGKVALAGLSVPELFPNQVLHHGGAPAQASAETLPKLPVRLQFLSLNAAVSTQEMIPSIPRMMINIHLCFIIKKGIQGAL